METKYYKAPIYVAERLGVKNIRRSAGEGFVILSESDMKTVDVTVDEKVQLFGCEVLTEEQANILIANNVKGGNNE